MSQYPGAAGRTHHYVGDKQPVSAGALVPYTGKQVEEQKSEDSMSLVAVGDKVNGVRFQVTPYDLPDFAENVNEVKEYHLGGKTWEHHVKNGMSPNLPANHQPLDLTKAKTMYLRFGTDTNDSMVWSHDFPNQGSEPVTITMSRNQVLAAMGDKAADEVGDRILPLAVRVVSAGSTGIHTPLGVRFQSKLGNGSDAKTTWGQKVGSSAGKHESAYAFKIDPNTTLPNIDRKIYKAPKKVNEPDYIRFAGSNFGAMARMVEAHTSKQDSRFAHIPMPSSNAVIFPNEVSLIAVTRKPDIDQKVKDPSGEYGAAFEDYEPRQHVFVPTVNGSSLVIPKKGLLDEIDDISNTVDASKTQMDLSELQVHFTPLGSWARHGNIAKEHKKRPPGAQEPASAFVELAVDYVPVAHGDFEE